MTDSLGNMFTVPVSDIRATRLIGPSSDQTKLELHIALSDGLVNQQLELVIYDDELYRASPMFVHEHEQLDAGKRLFYPFFQDTQAIVPEILWDPPMGPGSGVLFKALLTFGRIPNPLHKSAGFLWFVSDQLPLPNEGQNPDRPYSVELRLAKPKKGLVSGQTIPDEDLNASKSDLAYRRVGDIGYCARDFADTEHSRQPRRILIRAVLVQRNGPIKAGTLVLSNLDPQNVPTHPSDFAARRERSRAHARLTPFSIYDKELPRSLVIGKDGGTHHPSGPSEAADRMLEPDLTGYYEPEESAKGWLYPPFYVWLNQAGHQHVGWFGPIVSPLPPGKPRAAPALDGLPEGHGVFLTHGEGAPGEKEPDLTRGVIPIRWRIDSPNRAEKLGDPTAMMYDPQRYDAGTIEPVDAEGKIIRVTFFPDKPRRFRRIHAFPRVASGMLDDLLKESSEEVSTSEFPADTAKRIRSEYLEPVPELVWRDLENELDNKGLFEAVSEFWYGRKGSFKVKPMGLGEIDISTADDKGAMKNGAAAGAKVLSDALGRFPAARRNEARERLLAAAGQRTIRSGRLEPGTRTGPHNPAVWRVDSGDEAHTQTALQWLVDMVTFEVDIQRKGSTDDRPLEALYPNVSPGFQLAEIHPAGQFEYELTFTTIGKSGGHAGLGGQVGGFSLHFTQWRLKSKGGKAVREDKPAYTTLPAGFFTKELPNLVSGPLRGFYLSIGAGASYSVNIGGKGGAGAGASGTPPSLSVRSAADLRKEDLHGAEFRIVAASGPSGSVPYQSGTLGSFASMSIALKKKPHVRLAGDITMPPDYKLFDWKPKASQSIPKTLDPNEQGIVSGGLFTLTVTWGKILLDTDLAPAYEPTPAKPKPRVKHDEEHHLAMEGAHAFLRASSQLDRGARFFIEVQLATYRALLEAPGGLSVTGYASPEGEEDRNLALSLQRARRIRAVIVDAVGEPGEGVIHPKKVFSEPIGLGEEPARSPPDNLKDPESIPDPAERKRFIMENEGNYRRWRKVEIWLDGILSGRAMYPGGTNP